MSVELLFCITCTKLKKYINSWINTLAYMYPTRKKTLSNIGTEMTDDDEATI